MSMFDPNQPAVHSTTNTHAQRLPARRRSWSRFLYQFSLRSLLIATTLVAVGCWWYLQPATHEEPLGGGELRLRRQVRTVQQSNEEAQVVAAGQSDEAVLVSDGSYRIFDLEDHLLVDGRMIHDRRSGWWTTYHANGRKAAEGKVVRGERTGLWKTWYPSGVLASETTYVPASAVDPERLGWAIEAWPAALREGVARAWHPSGHLKLEGMYVADERDGIWSYYDEQGQLTARGAYVKNVRHGEWAVRDSAGEDRATVTYVAGRPKAEHEALLARVRADLASDDRRRQLNAVRALEELGDAGTAALRQAFAHGDEITQLLTLRSLLRVGGVQGNMMSQLQPLTRHSTEPLALRAMLAAVVVSHQDGRVDKSVFDRLMQRLEECPKRELRIEVLQALCQLDLAARPELFQQLVATVAEPSQEEPFVNRYPSGIGPTEDERWRLAMLDVSPLLLVKADLPPLLLRAFASSDPKVRATVLRTAEKLVERGPPDREQGYTAHWDVPPELRLLVEQGNADSSEMVREFAQGIGTQSYGGGCILGSGFSGGIGGLTPAAGGGFF